MAVKLDILVLAVHPDDAELGCGGTILKHVAMGYKVGIVDLTRGELGTRGTADIRDKEAQAAGKILGLTIRENLSIPDGFLKTHVYQLKIIGAIRKYQPDIVITNAYHDRHPDHGRSNQLVEASAFLSGLIKIETLDNDGAPQQAWRPKQVLHFIQDNYIKPDFVIDVTEFWDKKMESIFAYGSQFYNPDWNSDEPQTYISSPQFTAVVEGRGHEFGKAIGVKFAEGFTSRKILGVDSLMELR